MRRSLFIGILMAVLAVGLTFGTVHAKSHVLTISTSGTTTAASGTSNFMVDGGSGVTIPLVDDMEGYFSFQLSSVTPQVGWTFSQISGVTMTVSYKVSNYDTPDHWAAESATTIMSAVQVSGNTRYVYEFYPKFARYIRLYFSGGTPFGHARGIVTYR